MQVEIALNNAKGGVELLFSEKPPIALSNRLKVYGFKPVNGQPLKRYAPQHPAFINYAKALQEALLKGKAFLSVHIQPSFTPSRENIDNTKFSYIIISLKGDDGRMQDSYVVFDSYKKVAAAIATRYGKHKYKEAFKDVTVYPRNYKVRSRALLKKGKVITGMTDQGSEPEGENWQHIPLNENEKQDIIQAFLKFADKRISEAPEVTITDHELPLMFSGWLRQNHPGLMPQKDELWSIAERYKEKHTGSSPQEKAKDPYTNEHGVYTPQSAGHRYTEIEIPIPKTAKYKAKITAVRGADELHRATFSMRKEFGDVSGRSIPLTKDDPTHNSLTEATIAAAEGIIKRLERDLEHEDSILNNEEKKRERADKAIKAVKQYIAEISPNTKPPETTDKKPGKKSDRERLIELGFKGLFTAQQAFTMPFTVMDLQSRYYDAYQHLEEQYQKPADKQVEKWKSILDALKGKRDKASTEKRKKIIDNIRKKIEETAAINALIENENIDFQQEIIQRIIEWAKTLGYTFEDQDQTGEFSAYISEALFNERMIEPYYKKPIPEIMVQIVRDFFDGEKAITDTSKIWAIPLDDYLNQIATDQDDDLAREAGRVDHKMAVFNAMIAGNTITDTVLKDYPGLQEQEKFQVGFDGTDFKSEKQFRSFLKLAGISPDLKAGKMIDFPDSNPAYLWQGAGIKMITATNPLKKGYASFIGIQGEREKVLEATKRIEELTNSGASIGLEYITFKDYNFDSDNGLGGDPENSKPDTGKNGKTKHLLSNPIIDIDDAWTMTPLEYQQMKAIERTGNPMVLNAVDRRNHEAIVKQAIEEKKAVPKRVLAHYPWLVEKAPKEAGSEQPEKSTKTSALKKFERFISKNEVIDGHLYDGELKATYEKLGKAALKQLAEYLGLKDYQVDFEKGHKGVSGQLSLKGMFTPDKGIFISIIRGGITEQDLEWLNKVIVYQSITHINDDKGGPVNILNQLKIGNPELIKRKVYRLLGLQQEQGVGPATKSNYDYLDRVISHLHKMYDNGKRPTKTQIEKLGKELGVPNNGLMWEAAELSWLLWYKGIYNEPLPFEVRLKKMIHFWNDLQPTYDYSDSSKELYKQYSTPCPIGAMIAQYTGMDTAESIFEPSAGNGLLLVGADPRKTHVNEIDPTRIASLIRQGFSRTTNYNAAKPFDESMTKAYDVVVTNPPFTRWEETKTDKEYIVRKYFNGMMGLTHHIRLEHVMAGLALHCMKDDGKASIIIMGHVYFKDGYFGKYRPFFNWLYRHYLVSDVINLNSFNLYNKQGAIRQTMLILVNGRKLSPKGVAPTQEQAAYLYDMVNSFEQLWERIKPHVGDSIDILIKQLKIELGK